MPDKTISIIGCGWLGLPLAEDLLRTGYSVKGSTTSSEKMVLLRQKGIDAHQLRLNPEPVGDITALLEADTLIIDVPPKAGKLGDDFHPQQIQHLTNAIQPSPIKHIIYVSSTSVYPELGRIMLEDDVTNPDQSASPALIQAEQLVQSLAPERIVTVIRCGGLMGYDRIPGKYVAGRTVESGGVPVNYLHRNDAVGILSVIVQQGIIGTFNAVAPQHPTREAIYRKSCADFNYELPTFITPTKPVPYKVISVGKLIQTTNYIFQYPDPLQFLYQL
ncbi:Rossmann-fold NAD(P)-binding domain-containing protein [Spirosoma flavum]|uniref:SDR family NAD(P)-dependent oxidoreductase n=1 Tax=Spirosoma flavum TaxID=2048557 RepID=A0ABW6AU00_9BACT